MQLSIELALDGVEKGHGPFGAVIIQDNAVVGYGTNRVTSSNDPTAHAEICAIRDACSNLSNFSLAGLEIYTSCEPCPMCLGAIFWSRISKIYYGATRSDAAKINFDDHRFYEELAKTPESRNVPMVQMLREECIKVFDAWERNINKIPY